MPQRIDEAGNKYGDWKVIAYAGNQLWNLECVHCGATRTAKGPDLRRNSILKCPNHCRVCKKAPPNIELVTDPSAGHLCASCYRKRRRKIFKRWLHKPGSMQKFKASGKRSTERSVESFLSAMARERHRLARIAIKRKSEQSKPESFLTSLAGHRRRLVITRAKNGIRSRPFDLSAGFLIKLWHKQRGRCALTGLPMHHRFNDPLTVSVDRIDSNVGYEDDNVQLVCQWVNLAKGRLDNEAFKAILATFVALHGGDYKV